MGIGIAEPSATREDTMAAPVRLPDPLPVRHPTELTLLRLGALECRAAARLELAGACRALDPAARPGELAAVIARALPQVLRQRPRILAPGAPDRTFDEAWLLAVLEAVRRGDRVSERFLLSRRCHPHRAAYLALLLREYDARLAA
jgi:hypothetical protein